MDYRHTFLRFYIDSEKRKLAEEVSHLIGRTVREDECFLRGGKYGEAIGHVVGPGMLSFDILQSNETLTFVKADDELAALACCKTFIDCATTATSTGSLTQSTLCCRITNLELGSIDKARRNPAQASSSIILELLAKAAGLPSLPPNDDVTLLNTLLTRRLCPPLLLIVSLNKADLAMQEVIVHSFCRFAQKYPQGSLRCLVTLRPARDINQFLDDLAHVPGLAEIHRLNRPDSNEAIATLRECLASDIPEQNAGILLCQRILDLYQTLDVLDAQPNPRSVQEAGMICVRFLKGLQNEQRTLAPEQLSKELSWRLRPTGSFGETVLEDYLGSLRLFFAPKDEGQDEAKEGQEHAVEEARRDDGRPGFLYTEVTGYAILDAIRLYEITGDVTHLERAKRCADWLRDSAKARPHGGFLTRLYHTYEERATSTGQYMLRDANATWWNPTTERSEPVAGAGWFRETSFTSGNVYSFDNAICLKAICAVYRSTNIAEYLQEAKELGEFLLAEMTNDRGTVAPVICDDGSKYQETAECWSQRFGPHHAKVAEAFVDLAATLEAADEPLIAPEYWKRANAICNRIFDTFRKPSGAFETSSGKVELHSLCYCAEGFLRVGRDLIHRGEELGRKRSEGNGTHESRSFAEGEDLQRDGEKFVDVSIAIVRWAWEYCDAGAIPQVVYLPRKGENVAIKGGETRSATPSGDSTESRPGHRTDSLAQILTLTADLRRHAQLKSEYWDRAHELAAFLVAQKGKDKIFDYGFYDRSVKRVCNDGTTETYEADTKSYWTQAFCLQALWDYRLTNILQNAVVVILAGGEGKRFWPLSGKAAPKAFSRTILGDRSLLQETIRRFTDAGLFQPKDIYVLCDADTKNEAVSQAGDEHIPETNVILEDTPAGTFTGSMQVLEKVARNCERNRDLLVVVSAADDYFRPISGFQAALKASLVNSWEQDRLTAVAKRFDTQSENEFESYRQMYGYFRYSSDDRCDSRIRDTAKFIRSRHNDGDCSAHDGTSDAGVLVAWDCFTLVARESWLQKRWNELKPSTKGGKRNLDKEALTAKNVSVALLDDDVVFGDVGTFGRHYLNLFGTALPSEDGKECIVNAILGSCRETVRLLQCKDNVIIADHGALQVFGLEDHLIIDCESERKPIAVPLKKVPGRELNELIEEEKERKTIEADRNVESNCSVVGRASLPSVAQYFDLLREKEKTDRKMVEHLILVTRIALLIGRELGIDPKSDAFDLCKTLALWHDFGGYLSPALVDKERELIDRFGWESALERLRTDSRVVFAIMNPNTKRRSIDDTLASPYGSPHSVWPASLKADLFDYFGMKRETEVLNDSVNSAVLFARHWSLTTNTPSPLQIIEESKQMGGSEEEVEERTKTRLEDRLNLDEVRKRDVIVRLLSDQDNPTAYGEARKWSVRRSHPVLCRKKDIEWDSPHCECGHMLDKAFQSLKVADIIVNGRWVWKRIARGSLHSRQMWFEDEMHPVCDLSGLMHWIVRELEKADLAHQDVVNVLHTQLRNNQTELWSILIELQKCRSEDVQLEIESNLCDRLYLEWIGSTETWLDGFAKELGVALSAVSEDGTLDHGSGYEAWEFVQLTTFAENLATVAAHDEELEGRMSELLPSMQEMLVAAQSKLIRMFHKCECKNGPARLTKCLRFLADSVSRSLSIRNS